jgi:hypothetical protein
MEEENCLKTFTACHNFDLESEVENNLQTDKEAVIINSKVA